MKKILKDKRIFIEFTGLPCSGKSTISHELANLMRKDDYEVDETPYNLSHKTGKLKRVAIKLFYAIRLLVLEPIQIINVLSLKKISLSNKFNICYVYSMYLRKGECIYVLDQGFAQSIMAVLECKKNTEVNIEKILNMISNKKIIIYQIFVNASKRTIELRSNNRTMPCYFSESKCKDLIIEKGINDLEVLKRLWNNTIAWSNFIEITSEQNISMAAEEIYKNIKLEFEEGTNETDKNTPRA